MIWLLLSTSSTSNCSISTMPMAAAQSTWPRLARCFRSAACSCRRKSSTRLSQSSMRTAAALSTLTSSSRFLCASFNPLLDLAQGQAAHLLHRSRRHLLKLLKHRQLCRLNRRSHRVQGVLLRFKLANCSLRSLKKHTGQALFLV
jgi:hypothetical protein